MRVKLSTTAAVILLAILISPQQTRADEITPQPIAPTIQQPQEITLAFTGDIHGENPIKTTINNHSNPLSDFKQTVKGADVVVVNLETAITQTGHKRDKQYSFKSTPKLLSKLKNAGVTLVSLANNHTFDYSLEGFKNTTAALDKAGLLYVGAGLNSAQAYAPQVLTVRGVKIAFLATTFINGENAPIATSKSAGTTDGYNTKAVKTALKKARKAAEYLVILTHWGQENTTQPSSKQKLAAENYLAWGADAVIGGHPHVLQPIAVKSGQLVAYSLGNFIFYSHKKLNNQTGVLKITLTDQGVYKSHTFIKMKINPATGIPALP